MSVNIIIKNAQKRYGDNIIIEDLSLDIGSPLFGEVAIIWLIGKSDLIFFTSPTFIPFLLSRELASI